MVNVIKPSFITHEDDKAHPLPILSVDISPDGSRLATGGLDQKIKVWNTDPILDEEQEDNAGTKKLLSTLSAHTGNVLCVRWSPDGLYLASGSDDNIVIVWEKDDTAFGRKVFGQVEENHEVWKAAGRLVGHQSDVSSLAWSKDGYFLATGGSDTNIMVWETHTFARLKTLTFHQGFVKGLAFDPTGELLASQSDDQSVCIWKTTDWSLIERIDEPFRNSPNASWFRRLSWSPEGTFLAVPNSVNNGVFVAGILKRKQWDAATSLVGHDNVIDVTAFNPISFLKDPRKPASASNLCSVLAVAARSCISVWLTSQVRPIVVFDTIVDRDTLDLSWSADGNTLYACSSEGHIAVMQFALEELGHPAPPDAQKQLLASWGFTPSYQFQVGNGNSSMAQGARTGTANAPNVLVARPKKQARAETPLLPIPPPGAPQKITISQTGKRRIQPTFLGLGGIVPRQGSVNSLAPERPTPALQPAFQTSTSYTQPGPSHITAYERDILEARMQGTPGGVPLQATRTPLQDIGVPSWGAPQDQAMQFAVQASRKRKANEMDFDETEEDARLSIAPSRPSGRTLGGDRPPAPPYTGSAIELRPAYAPKTITQIPSEQVQLAVPAIKAHQVVKWDHDGEDAEVLEWRNFADRTRPSEVSQSNSKGKVQWLDYCPSAIVNGTFAPAFSAVSCEDNVVNVYSPSGRHIMPTMILDGPASFLDAAGDFLLALTSRGTLTVWDTRKRKAILKPINVYTITSLAPTTTGSVPVINTVKVRANGCPILSLSNGLVVTYDQSLESWTQISTPWWSKGSEYWESRIRSNNSAGRGVVKIIESETNDFLAAQPDLVMMEGDEARLRPSLEGEEQKKLGNDDDWKMALTLGHLESRMNAAIALDSLPEYRMFLTTYAKRLAEEAFRGKAEELVKDLIGPIYHKPGREDAWQSTLLGVSKHSLLREVLSVFMKSKTFNKLASDTNEILRKMASDL